MDFMSEQYYPYLHQRNVMDYGSQYGRPDYYDDYGTEQESSHSLDEENSKKSSADEEEEEEIDAEADVDEDPDARDPKMDGKNNTLGDPINSKFQIFGIDAKYILKKMSDFCSWNCFFSLMFVMGVLLVFLDHYDSAYVRMLSMQKFFFFVMGVLTTTVAVVVVIVVVAFTSCYGDGF